MSNAEYYPYFVADCMQSIPLAVLKQPTTPHDIGNNYIACNPYRLRY